MSASLRLQSLVVENFRSISGKWTVPLDADVVLVHGPNGAGKTSLLSAIELAATGKVAFIDEASDGLSTLVNRNYPLGRVELQIDTGTSVRVGAYDLDARSRRGRPALSGKERLDFSERSFLPQTVLGRLLESYAAPQKTDNALVRFVKDLVGVDELDALIMGLRTSGHIARVREASEMWGDTEQAIHDLDAQKRALAREIKSSERTLSELAQQLPQTGVELDAEGDPERVAEAAVIAARGLQPARDELAELEARRLRLEGVLIAIRDSTDESLLDVEETLAARAVEARTQFDQWEETDGAQVLVRLNAVRETIGLPPSSGPQLFESLEATRDRISIRGEEERTLKNLMLERERRRAINTEAIAKIELEMSAIRESISASPVSDDVRALIGLLQAATPLIDSDSCPVCQQEFPGGQAALRSHVSSRIGHLSSAAQAYAVLTHTDQQFTERHVALLQEREELGPITAPTKESPDIAGLTRELNTIDTLAAHGRALYRSVEASQGKLAEVSAVRSTLNVADQALASLVSELGLERGDSPVAEEARLVEVHLEEMIQRAQFQVSLAQRATEASNQIQGQLAAVEDLRERLRVTAKESADARSRLAEATRRKKAASQLRLDAEKTRSRLINEVFDNALNRGWADFFARLVPSEPFIPQFKKQTKGSRTIDVAIETVLPDGGSYGSPSSVLSFGNANTAALSLFLALHVSAPTSVNWIVFDDPVQSMDDIHVANFAAVIRQLTLTKQQQIVIAVHQRELFEYLAFELAPARPTDSLLKISLDRQGDVSLIEVDRVHFTPEAGLARAH